MPTHRFMPFGRAAVILGSLALMLVSPGARADSGQIGRTGLEPIAPEARPLEDRAPQLRR